MSLKISTINGLEGQVVLVGIRAVVGTFYRWNLTRRGEDDAGNPRWTLRAFLSYQKAGFLLSEKHRQTIRIKVPPDKWYEVRPERGYLPKLENHLEARLWNDVFNFAQYELGIPIGTIRATVLIETILAAFEMDEILYELRHHAAGLNCGRWDYIFSFIKKFRNRPKMVLPDRAQVTMTTHFLRSYSLLAIKTCHRRGAAAIAFCASWPPSYRSAAISTYRPTS